MSMSLIRALPFVCLILGACLLASAGYDEFRGITRAPMGKPGANPYGRGIVLKEDPKSFRNAMSCHWFNASLLIAAGLVFHCIVRKQDSLDPLAPDGND